ncbi:TPA: hypothetical protein HA281_04280 [Candidatus Woesearchaeota archaeon]|nr:MAG: hypothetical protein QT04_C0046G0022 [archaeon GW2011_AR11]MBS3110930.1 hypothetical protein [Candidatus Woesearchaeota archaeon]HIH05527.1 hypothetical protein [Candidatus Woesearchaeota archaeon]HIH91996.1 hypothetical protein [Candidatus Woesearchaeota archaeon]HII64571.1 hypothetical protein [Candidatus Woesearchaeota archaeon]
MATFLDASGLQHFSAVFVFIFVFIAAFAMFSYMKIFDEHKWVPWFAALLIAFFILISPLATKVVQNIAPWFAVLFVFVILIGVAAKMVGDAEISFMKPLFLVLVIVLVFVGAGTTIRSNVIVPGDNESSSDFTRDYSQTSTIVFHPKFMGMMLIFAIAIFTIAMLVTSKL